MFSWRRDKKDSNAVVLVARRKNHFYALRGIPAANGGHVLKEGVFSAENMNRLPDLFREKLEWERNEIIYRVRETPLLFGSSVSVRETRYEAGHPVVLDKRECLHKAQWKAADTAKEEAADYFGCALEEIKPFAYDVQYFREASDAIEIDLFQTCVPSFKGDTYPDRRPVFFRGEGVSARTDLNHFVAPFVLSREIGEKGPDALLHTEDNLTSFAVRKNGRLLYFRSLEIGVDVINRALQKILDCDEHEADLIIKNCLEGKLEDKTKKTIFRIMRDLLPLWAGMFSVFVEGIPTADRPAKLLVSGLYPKLVARLYCRPQILMRWSHLPVKVEVSAKNEDLLGMQTVLRILLKHVTKKTTMNKKANMKIISKSELLVR